MFVTIFQYELPSGFIRVSGQSGEGQGPGQEW